MTPCHSTVGRTARESRAAASPPLAVPPRAKCNASFSTRNRAAPGHCATLTRAALRRTESDHNMSHCHHLRLGARARHGSRRASRGVPRGVPRGVVHRRLAHPSVAGQRARIVAQLIAADHALPNKPDVAALLLDGALSQLLDEWARSAHIRKLDPGAALSVMEADAPAIAWRLRLALQAQAPEARLAHCWALLDLLTPQAATFASSTISATNNAHSRNDHSNAWRKDRQSHVS